MIPPGFLQNCDTSLALVCMIYTLVELFSPNHSPITAFSFLSLLCKLVTVQDNRYFEGVTHEKKTSYL